ncbi:hypothetical protein FJZ53_06040 [Candidatus Woesearchaeota archaeon]|nr:hypothetical protein [Candidatus Woesearchaeota archaeon]
MVDLKTRECDRCRKTVPVSQLKYIMKGKDNLIAVCEECRINASKPGATDIKSGKKAPDKRVYFCAKCRYKFKFDPASGNKLICPYCGNPNYVAEYEVLTSQKLVDRADKEP